MSTRKATAHTIATRIRVHHFGLQFSPSDIWDICDDETGGRLSPRRVAALAERVYLQLPTQFTQ